MVNWIKRNADRFAVVIGYGLISYGIHQIHAPSAFIAAGLLLLAGVFVPAYLGGRRDV
ncbi:MAG TPA: hypothetical protein VMZ50_02780 [Phycisphaerae bacterium]|nr:hypothetical protein [Phycisphaerae bacterium]